MPSGHQSGAVAFEPVEHEVETDEELPISLTLYLLLQPSGRGLAMVAAAVRLLYSATVTALLIGRFTAHRLLVLPGGAVAGPGAARLGSSALQTCSDGFGVALLFLGVHLLLLGAALHRSGYVPRVLCRFVVAAGGGYVVDSLAGLLVDGYGGAAAVVALTPTVIGGGRPHPEVPPMGRPADDDAHPAVLAGGVATRAPYAARRVR